MIVAVLPSKSDIVWSTEKVPVAFESAKVTYLKNKDIFKELEKNKKKLIFEEDKDDSSLLDDSQLKSK